VTKKSSLKLKPSFKDDIASKKRERFELRHGDSLKVLKDINPNTFDSIVTDPPYGLSFMGNRWDYDVPSVELWQECLRVLKPGGYLLAFSGTRTYHRMVVAIEDAGFEICDQMQWLYGRGFPKSHDISKAIDKQFGVEREVIGTREVVDMRGGNYNALEIKKMQMKVLGDPVTAAAAAKWDGWGTALKPANEPICVAQKPISEDTIAKNVLMHGTGGLNIDASRIGDSGGVGNVIGQGELQSDGWGTRKPIFDDSTRGRFPANILFDEYAAGVLDEQSGILKSGANPTRRSSDKFRSAYGEFKGEEECIPARGADSGGASRFFYVSKPSADEKHSGLDESNFHPTVKPINLMHYLIRLVTRPGGTVLDPFMGSGSTGIAAIKNDFKFFGIDQDKEFFELAKARIQGVYRIKRK